jgi:hypothetical protein
MKFAIGLFGFLGIALGASAGEKIRFSHHLVISMEGYRVDGGKVVPFSKDSEGKPKGMASITLEGGELGLVGEKLPDLTRAISSVLKFGAGKEKASLRLASEFGDCDDSVARFSVLRKGAAGKTKVETYSQRIDGAGECSGNSSTRCELTLDGVVELDLKRGTSSAMDGKFPKSIAKGEDEATCRRDPVDLLRQ